MQYMNLFVYVCPIKVSNSIKQIHITIEKQILL